MKDNNKSKKWIAVYTKPRHEKSVKKELSKKGIESYLPVLRVKRMWSDRKKWVELPLFKSYLFIRTEFSSELSVVKTPGILNIVKFGGDIAVIKNKSINYIKQMIDGGYKPEPIDYFISGDLVEVKWGPLKGIRGEVVKIHGHDCLLIKVDAIKHSICIRIERRYLKYSKL